MEIGSAKLKRLVAHQVGNKIRDESLILSISELDAPKEVSSIILKNYLGGILKSGNQYEFFHESNIQLNELNVFAGEIFSDDNIFLDSSIKIAKHLYSKSTHPNISGGDFFISLFEGITIDGAEKRAIGLFKTEIKETFLSIKNEKGTLILEGNVGINPKEIQKAALIIEGDMKIYALERGNNKTTYWIEDFLKIKPIATPKAAASFIGKMIKKTISEIVTPLEVENYKQQLDSLFETSEATFQELSSINEDFIGKEKTSTIINDISNVTKFEIPPQTVLENKLGKKIAKLAFRRINITLGVDVILTGKSPPKIVKKDFSENNRLVTICINLGDII